MSFKFIFVLITLTLFCSCQTATSKKGEWNGNIKSVEEKIYKTTDANGSVGTKTLEKINIYTFKNERLSVIYNYDKDQNIQSTNYVRQYNPDGQAKSFQKVGLNNDVIQTEYKNYNENNILISENYGGELERRISYEIENNQRVKAIWRNKSDIEFRHLEFEHNNKGDISKETRYLPSGRQMKLIEYDYQYDSKKNWVIKKIKEDGLLVKSIERKITYN